MIDQIEHYVNSAADHTNKGVEAMTAAVKQQKKSRKRMCCIFFGLMLLILAVVILVTSKLFCPSSKCLRSPRYSLGRRDP
jgi:t-SNARE complex subunit (syntaxin)